MTIIIDEHSMQCDLLSPIYIILLTISIFSGQQTFCQPPASAFEVFWVVFWFSVVHTGSTGICILTELAYTYHIE